MFAHYARTAMNLSDPIPPTVVTEERDAATAAFYREVLLRLNAASVPYLVGGTYAFNRYTGINRPTKDLDLFIRRSDFEQISALFKEAGYRCELTFPHWLGKIYLGENYIDLIFSSGNAVASVDDAWFEFAADAQVLSLPARISPIEEMIWSKAFIMEKERFDGADIAHLINACSARIDWTRLVRRFGEHWRVLLSHLVLFGFAYPATRDLVPVGVMDELIRRLSYETHAPPPATDLCLGTLLSREQYLNDIHLQGLQDARVQPVGNMTPEDTASWTRAIADDHEPEV
jgi:hypothetical protein